MGWRYESVLDLSDFESLVEKAEKESSTYPIPSSKRLKEAR